MSFKASSFVFVILNCAINNFQLLNNKKKRKQTNNGVAGRSSYILKFNMIEIYWLGAAEFLVCNSNKFFQALESAISKLA